MSPTTDAAVQQVMKKVLSEAQMLANRRNAEKSTGPKTEEGKKKSALNATRHGLTGQVTTMTDPDRAFYNVFLDGFLIDWSPKGATEVQLVTRIAQDSWRLNRASAIEDNIFAIGVGFPAVVSSEGHPEIDDSFAQARTYEQKAKTLQLLTLYEQRIQRSVEKNKKMLTEMQTERREREAKEMTEAKRLLQLAEMKRQEYKPEADGFVFSIDRIRQEIDRDRRLKQAAGTQISRSERKKLRRMSFAKAA